MRFNDARTMCSKIVGKLTACARLTSDGIRTETTLDFIHEKLEELAKDTETLSTYLWGLEDTID